MPKGMIDTVDSLTFTSTAIFRMTYGPPVSNILMDS